MLAFFHVNPLLKFSYYFALDFHLLKPTIEAIFNIKLSKAASLLNPRMNCLWKFIAILKTCILYIN